MAINVGPFKNVIAYKVGKDELKYVVSIAGDGGNTSVFPPPPTLTFGTNVAGSWAWPNVTDFYPDFPATNDQLRARIDEVDGYFIAFQDQPQPPAPSIMPITIFFLLGKWIVEHRAYRDAISVDVVSRFPTSSLTYSFEVTAGMTIDEVIEASGFNAEYLAAGV